MQLHHTVVGVSAPAALLWFICTQSREAIWTHSIWQEKCTTHQVCLPQLLTVRVGYLHPPLSGTRSCSSVILSGVRIGQMCTWTHNETGSVTHRQKMWHTQTGNVEHIDRKYSTHRQEMWHTQTGNTAHTDRKCGTHRQEIQHTQTGNTAHTDS